MKSKCNSNKMIMILIFILAMFISNNIILTENTLLTQISHSDDLNAVFSQSFSNPPIIQWPHSPVNATYTPVIAWDGAYTGQTQEVWSWTYWVNDTDGVDTVLFRFRWGYEDEWFNRSTVRVEGNSTNGRYNGNLTWGVEWNWEEGRPEWIDGGGSFGFKIFANDTLGNWIETSVIQYTGGYMIINPPPIYYISIIGPLLIIPAIAIIIFVVWKRRK